MFAPILKTQQEHILPRDSLDHTSQILPQPSQKSFQYLLLKLTYFGLDNRPRHDLSPPPLYLCYVWG